MTDPKGPVLIDLSDDTSEKLPNPAEAPPVPDPDGPTAEGRAMQTAATLAARRPSSLTSWFWAMAIALVGVFVSVAAWDFVTGLIARAPIFGYAVTGLVAAFVLVLVIFALREWIAFSRLKRLDRVHHAAAAALSEADFPAAQNVVRDLERLYAGREELRWGRDRLRQRKGDVFDASDLLGLAEDTLMDPLDQMAEREVEAAARQVATVTALVPLAFADVAAALTANLRMIRRIAEIYGGRAGTLGGWRLTRAVMTHLVATGAVAVGDDLLGSVAGGSILGKLSRRFGEGLVNGALTARVGVAAMEVCRPLPFARRRRPSVTGLVKRSLTGLFGS